MAVLLSWLQSNWVAVVGMVCGIGSLWYTGAYFRKDSQNHQLTNLVTITDRRDALWQKAQDNPKLKRVLQVDADLSEPPTAAECEFLIAVIIHFQLGWRVARATDKGELGPPSRDAADFFTRPLPRVVWEKTKTFRNPKFVRFVERAMK
ncbi:MAG: hypothetical protein ABSA83_22220 [Verrucomicrobiota bacterium]|jgi:hypothetical protein